MELQPSNMAECLFPFQSYDSKLQQNKSVPCGKCLACLSRRASAWSFRLMQEEKRSTDAHFITLTYDTQHTPITNHGYMSLDKRHCQNFFKELRRHSANRGRKIKYYLAGEYGGKTRRPHYHIILFNADIASILPSWGKGHVHYGDVTAASVGYSLKYITKPSKIPHHSNDDRLKEFALMSKGLGDNYVTKKMFAWHHADIQNRMYCNLPDGKKIAMPRYYKQQIYLKSEQNAIGAQARANMLKRQEKNEQDPAYYENKFLSDKDAIQRHNINHSKNAKL